MLKGSGYSVPDAIIASGTMKVEGHVFSKSRGYVVYVEEDYLANGLDPDALRYYIVSYSGHTRDLDFNWSTYGDKVNKELVGSLGNFIYRSLLFAHRNYGSVPEGEVDAEAQRQVEDAVEAIRDGLDEYEFKKICDAFLGLADYGNRYIQSREPWKLVKDRPEEAAEVIYNCVWLTKAIAVLMEPVLPFKSEKIYELLGLTTNQPLEEALAPLELGAELGKPEPLFRQVPDEEIEALEEAMVIRITRAKG
jgi:methionyl-tRNA synthetase